MEVGSPIPILRSFDKAKAKEFYIEFLEFKLDWEHRFEDGLPLYMRISKGNCVLHISEHYSDRSPGASLRIKVPELDQYQENLIEKSYKHARPDIQEMPWGALDMAIGDPSGNKLIFTNAQNT